MLGVQSQTATSGNTRCLHRNCKLHEALDSLLGETVFNAFHILKCSVISLVAYFVVVQFSIYVCRFPQGQGPQGSQGGGAGGGASNAPVLEEDQEDDLYN